jgi:hypothetical protein
MSSPAPSDAGAGAAAAAAPPAAVVDGGAGASAPPARARKGGKWAQKNNKRKAKRAAAEAGIEPGSAEENDPSKPWYKKPRKTGLGPPGSADRSAADAAHDPQRRDNNGLYSLNADSGGFMVAAPDCPKFNDYYKVSSESHTHTNFYSLSLAWHDEFCGCSFFSGPL